MLDRQAFDRQISSIRNKYSKINKPPISHDRSEEISFDLKSHSPFTSNNIAFTTPVKTSKNNKPEHVDSFKEQKEVVRDQNGIKEDLIRKKNNWVKKSVQKGYICMTSRETGSKGKDFDLMISEKQKVLTERMQKNQRLLQKSKELREGSLNQPETINTINLGAKNSIGDTFKEKTEMQLSQRLGNILRQKNCSKIENEPSPVKKITWSSNKVKESYQTDINKMRFNFVQKMNQLINANASSKRMPNRVIGSETTKITQNNLTNRQRLEYQKYKETKNKPSFKETPVIFRESPKLKPTEKNQFSRQALKERVECKTANVFEGTQKIQERIKALLSYH